MHCGDRARELRTWDYCRRLASIDIPSHYLAITQKQEDKYFIEGHYFLNNNSLCEGNGWNVSFLLNLLVIGTDVETAESVVGGCEHKLHALELYEADIYDWSTVLISFSNEVIVDCFYLKVSLFFHIKTGKNRIWHRFKSLDNICGILLLNDRGRSTRIRKPEYIDLVEGRQSINGLRVVCVIGIAIIDVDTLAGAHNKLSLVLVELKIKLSLQWTVLYRDTFILVCPLASR